MSWLFFFVFRFVRLFVVLLVRFLVFFRWQMNKGQRDRQTHTQLTPLGESLPQTYALPPLYLYLNLCPLCFLDVIMRFHNRKFTYSFLTTRRAADSSTLTHAHSHSHTETDTYLCVHTSWQRFHISKLRVFVSWEQEQQQQQWVGDVYVDVDVNAASQLQLL